MAGFQEKTSKVDVPYDIEIAPEAKRGLLAIPRKNQPLIVDAIDSLAFSPRPESSKLLRTAENLRRLTVGDYRVLYGIEESKRKVTIELVRHRGIVYQALAALALSVRSKYSR